MDNKVFCIGMFNTGTTSIGRALDILGYRTFHGPWWDRSKIIIDNFYEHPEKWPEYYENIKKHVKSYDAFEDYPFMFIYDKLYEWYPNSKFILSVKNSDLAGLGALNGYLRNRKNQNKKNNNIELFEKFKKKI